MLHTDSTEPTLLDEVRARSAAISALETAIDRLLNLRTKGFTA
ncbi:hypothetical protein [Microbacterium sp. Leaf179]|nr:hypothetical protein [Microbacterium sp. Leaf179]